jgi:hypothetical protein
MTEPEKAHGLIKVLVKRFEKHHLDRVLEIHRSVASGERLTDYEHELLENLCREAMQSKRFVDRCPEYQPLFARVSRLCRNIAAQALENEERQIGARQSVRV